jgi:ATP-dependent Clp protease ATP-binding subunit ClpC
MTDRARRVVILAEQEARKRGAFAVEPEHLLLGLAVEGHGVAATVLRYAGATSQCIAQELAVPTLSEVGELEALPWAEGTRHAVARAFEESTLLGHHYVGTEHLILGVAAISEGVAAQVLARLGVDAEAIRREVYDLLGHGLQ